MDAHEAVKEKEEEKIKENQCEDSHLLAKFKNQRPGFLEMLEVFVSMWNGHLGRIIVSKHLISLLNDEAGPVYPVPDRTDSKETYSVGISQILAKMGIEPATTEWAAIIAFVPKNDGSIRFHADYCMLNAVTIRDFYTLHRLDECMGILTEAIVSSILDASPGYLQIENDEWDWKKLQLSPTMAFIDLWA